MKRLFLLALIPVFLSSCCSIFTRSSQPITFLGESGTKIYRISNNMKIAEIGEDKSVTIRMKKKIEDLHVIAKKEGYVPTPLVVESSFNPTSLWNLLFFPGFLIDFGTGKINKYDNTVYYVEMEKDQNR